MALQSDSYGFIVGEKKFKELNGNINQIDETTKEILAVLTQKQKSQDKENGDKKATINRLIEHKKRQNSIHQQTLSVIKSYKKSVKNINANQASDVVLMGHNAKNSHIKIDTTANRNLSDKNESETKHGVGRKRNASTVQAGETETPNETPKKTANNKRLLNRDEKGRFVGEEINPLTQAIGKMSDAIWQYVQADTSQLSPEIDAINEVKDIISPAGRGLQAMGRGASWLYKRKTKKDAIQPPEQDKQNKQVNASNKEKRRLLRLILREIGNKSWLSSLLPFMTGLASMLGGGGSNRPKRGDGRRSMGGFFGVGGRKKSKRPTERPRRKLPESRKNSKAGNSSNPPQTIWDKARDKTKDWRSKGKSGLGKVGAGLKRIPIIGTVATAVMGALVLSDYKNMTNQERGSAIGGLAGTIGGGWAGTTAGVVAGATIGSMIPVVGTVAGGLIGGLVGGFGGGWLGGDIGSKIGEKLAPYGSQMVGGLSTLWANISSHAVSTLSTATSYTYLALSTSYEYTKTLANRVWETTKIATTTIKDYTLLSLERMKNVAVAGLTGYGGIIGSAVQSLGKLYDIAKNFVAEHSSSFIDWIKEKGGGIWDSIKDGAGSLVDSVAGMFGGSSSISVSNGVARVGNWQRSLKANKFDELLPMLEQKAKESGLDLSLLLAMANIESHFNPNAKNGSYQGLFQMGSSHMKAGENVLNAADNTNAAIRFIKENKAKFHRVMGNDAEFTAGHAYLMHQQGAGALQYLKNPNMNVVDAAMLNQEWRKRGRAATIAMIKKNGGNPNGTAGEFANMWISKANALQTAYNGNTQVNATATNKQPAPTNTKNIGGSGGGTYVPIGDGIATGILGKEQANQTIKGIDTTTVKNYIKHQVQAGAIKDKDVVLSTGASNEVANVNFKNIEQQIDLLVKAGAKSITMMSVADNWNKQKKPQRYQGKQYNNINEVLQKIALDKGVKFAKWNANSQNGYHADKATYERAIQNANYGKNMGKPISAVPMARPESKKTQENGGKQATRVLQPPKFHQPTKDNSSIFNPKLNLGLTSQISNPAQPNVVNSVNTQAFTQRDDKKIERVFIGDVSQNIADTELARLITGGYSRLS